MDSSDDGTDSRVRAKDFVQQVIAVFRMECRTLRPGVQVSEMAA